MSNVRHTLAVLGLGGVVVLRLWALMEHPLSIWARPPVLRDLADHLGHIGRVVALKHITWIQSIPAFLYQTLVLSRLDFSVGLSLHVAAWMLFLWGSLGLIRSVHGPRAWRAFALFLLFPFSWLPGAIYYPTRMVFSFGVMLGLLYLWVRSKSWPWGLPMGVLAGLQHAEAVALGWGWIPLLASRQAMRSRWVLWGAVMGGVGVGMVLRGVVLEGMGVPSGAVRMAFVRAYAPWLVQWVATWGVWWVWALLGIAWGVLPWIRPWWRWGIPVALAMGITAMTIDHTRVFNLLVFIPSFFFAWGDPQAVDRIPGWALGVLHGLGVLIPLAWLWQHQLHWIPLLPGVPGGVWTRGWGMEFCPWGSPGPFWDLPGVLP